MKKLLVFLLLAALGLQLCGCSEPQSSPESTETAPVLKTADGAKTVELTASVTAAPVAAASADDTASQAAADFAVRLLQNAYHGGENCILSPYSVLTAMAMVANGADGETLSQLEAALGLSVGDLNAFLYACKENAGDELVSANSIWMRDVEQFAVREDFLQANADYFGAEIYKAAFDAQTVADINDWVSEHTAGRIQQILERLDGGSSMVLLNALTFDAKWAAPYKTTDVREGTFTAADGTEQTVEMMHKTEQLYLDDSLATGFVKDYAGGRYCYAALLPNEGVSMEEYLLSLTGASLLNTLANAEECRVSTVMPKYKIETSAELNQALAAMGISDAFSPASANFSRISDTPQYIDEVLHKTYMKVDEDGTEAAAVTAVITRSGALMQSHDHTVILDRPYVMAIVDRETEAVVFLGVINSISE
ncbi:MAG: serpin family protein [Faecousia sp.]